jgi:hypothetical protein
MPFTLLGGGWCKWDGMRPKISLFRVIQGRGRRYCTRWLSTGGAGRSYCHDSVKASFRLEANSILTLQPLTDNLGRKAKVRKRNKKLLSTSTIFSSSTSTTAFQCTHAYSGNAPQETTKTGYQIRVSSQGLRPHPLSCQHPRRIDVAVVVASTCVSLPPFHRPGLHGKRTQLHTQLRVLWAGRDPVRKVRGKAWMRGERLIVHATSLSPAASQRR